MQLSRSSYLFCSSMASRSRYLSCLSSTSRSGCLFRSSSKSFTTLSPYSVSEGTQRLAPVAVSLTIGDMSHNHGYVRVVILPTPCILFPSRFHLQLGTCPTIVCLVSCMTGDMSHNLSSRPRLISVYNHWAHAPRAQSRNGGIHPTPFASSPSQPLPRDSP